MIKRTCGMPNCPKPHRARGLCSTHYNQQHASTEQRHAKQTVPCTWCQVDCVKDMGRERRYQGIFCSFACRDHWRTATGNNPSPSAEALAKGRAVRAGKRWQAKLKLKQAARGSSGRTWVAGACERCGTQFTACAKGADIGRYCSLACLKRASNSRRRAREAGAESERYSRHAIFMRDGWRCHICRRLVRQAESTPHPLAPTIDHLVPLAQGGGDTAANVATAHFICNSTKGDRFTDRGDQLALIG